MRRNLYFKYIFLAAALALSSLCVAAQETPTDDGPDGDHSVTERPQDPRFNLLRQLGLSREQIQRVRRMNAARRPMIRAAQLRFREANRHLDAAIYADEINEEDVRARLRDVQLAQADLIRIRSMDELAVRRILTPDQLLRFRELRTRFDRVREQDGGRPVQTPPNSDIPKAGGDPSRDALPVGHRPKP